MEKNREFLQKGYHAVILTIALASLMVLSGVSQAMAEATKAEINREVDAALKNLISTNSVARDFSKIAKGILVFPNVVKAGLLVGGQYGEGALLQGGKKVAYYNTVAASYGLQAGAQTFGYVLFFMNNNALDHLKSTQGWELGVGPSVVIVDEGLAKSLTTTTARDDVYAFIFSQKGLMAGIGIQGSKITEIYPK